LFVTLQAPSYAFAAAKNISHSQILTRATCWLECCGTPRILPEAGRIDKVILGRIFYLTLLNSVFYGHYED
jgi:hypothetical protein